MCVVEVVEIILLQKGRTYAIGRESTYKSFSFYELYFLSLACLVENNFQENTGALEENYGEIHLCSCSHNSYAMTNLDSIFKSRDITLPTKVHLVKAMVFPVVMCGCESWIIQKAERRRIDAFELWCWRRLLRVLWTARRSNE